MKPSPAAKGSLSCYSCCDTKILFIVLLILLLYRENYLQSSNSKTGVHQGSSGPSSFCCTCHCFIQEPGASEDHENLSWGREGHIFRFQRVSEQTQQSISLPHAEISFIIFKSVELHKKGCCFQQWYFSAFTRNSENKKDHLKPVKVI